MEGRGWVEVECVYRVLPIFKSMVKIGGSSSNETEGSAVLSVAQNECLVLVNASKVATEKLVANEASNLEVGWWGWEGG